MLKGKALGYALLVAGLLFLLAYLSDIRPLEEDSRAYLSKGLKVTLSTYVVLRGINAGVSVLKESNVSLAPAGVGVSLALGQVLDPIDDATERLSTLMLLSFASLGIQQIMLDLFADPLLLLVSVGFVLSGFAVLMNLGVRSLLLKLTLILFLLRFIFPVSGVISNYVYDSYIEGRITSLKVELESTLNVLSSIEDKLSSPSEFKESLRELPKRVGVIADSMMSLAVLFIFQMLVLPLLSLWLMVKLIYGVLGLRL